MNYDFLTTLLKKNVSETQSKKQIVPVTLKL